MADNDTDLVPDPRYPDETFQERRIDDYVNAMLALDLEPETIALQDAANEASHQLAGFDFAIAFGNLQRARDRRAAEAEYDNPDHPGFVGDAAAALLAEDAAKPFEDLISPPE